LSPSLTSYARANVALLVSLAFVYATLPAAAADWLAIDVAVEIGLSVKDGTDGQLCVTDVNGDGHSDVLLARHGGELWPLMRQELGGSFVQVQLLGPINDRHSCTVGDFASVTANGSYGPPDGRPDFYTTVGACQGICTKEYPNNLYIQRLDGSFQDAAAAFGVTDPHGRGRETVTLDANLDGLDDIFLTNEISSLYPSTSNHLYLNTGPGFVEWVDPAVTLSLSSTCARAVDFNNDGRTDLVVCTPQRTYFLANLPAGFAEVGTSLGITGAFREVAVADFNGDGHADLAAIQASKLTVRLWRSSGSPWGAVSYTFTLTQGRTLAVGDFFGTGLRRDIFVVDGWTSANSLQKPDWVLRWTGTATTATFETYPVPPPPARKLQ
jgi:hypothetical protein